MERSKRRKLIMALLGAGTSMGALHAVWASPVAYAVQPTPRRVKSLATCNATMQALLIEAGRWIANLHAQGQTIVPFPISRLQRHFAFGYSYTCTLAQLLVESGQWTIAFAADGSRYARLHPTALQG